MAKKYCWYCNKNLDTSMYHKSKKRPDGLQGMCKDCHKSYRNNWLSKNSKKYKQKCKEWSSNNRDKIYEVQKLWRKNNREHFRKQQREYKSVKRKTDIMFKITSNLRNRVRKAVRGINKSKTTIQLLGCSIENFKLHIENHFQSGMTWENYGQWELDHIKPCCSFDLTKESEQLLCFHYSNMQPLWKKDHRDKTKKDIEEYLN